MRNRPQPFELYRHFKGNLYQVLCIAGHSETGEEMVVYQALYGDYKFYVRPLAMFMEPVDRVKYPNVAQEWRFEKVSAQDADKPAGTAAVPQMPPTTKTMPAGPGVSVIVEPASTPTPATATDQEEPASIPATPFVPDQEEENAALDPDVERFLDARTYGERIEILIELREKITDDMIDIMSTVLDIEIPKGSLVSRYDKFKNALEMRRHYEAARLR